MSMCKHAECKNERLPLKAPKSCFQARVVLFESHYLAPFDFRFVIRISPCISRNSSQRTQAARFVRFGPFSRLSKLWWTRPLNSKFAANRQEDVDHTSTMRISRMVFLVYMWNWPQCASTDNWRSRTQCQDRFNAKSEEWWSNYSAGYSTFCIRRAWAVESMI